MRPRWYEAPVANLVNGQAGKVRVSPGMWKGDDGVRATATIVSVRRDSPTGEIVYGAREVPPASSPRDRMFPGMFTADPFILDLPPGVMRIQVWRGSPTTDGNQPGAPLIYEWGFEASDYTVKPAECYITVPGVPPPPTAPLATTVRNRMLVEAKVWQDAQAAPTPLARITMAAEIVGSRMSDERWLRIRDAVRRELDR